MKIALMGKPLGLLATMACMIGLCGAVQAATIAVQNGDFEDDPQATPNGSRVISTAGPDFGWTAVGTARYGNHDGTFQAPKPVGFPGDTNLYFAGVAGQAYQDLPVTWNSSSVITLDFLAIEAGWRDATAGDQVTVELQETDGTVLWSASTSLDGTSTGGFGGAWLPVNHVITASTDFSGGTPGSQLRLAFSNPGNAIPASVYFADDVKVDGVNTPAVPEPTSIVLALLGAVGLAFRRFR